MSPHLAAIKLTKEIQTTIADTLTHREQEVLWLIGEGLITRQIAEHFGSSPKTIETHRAHIKEKLGLKTAGELSRVAVLYVELKTTT